MSSYFAYHLDIYWNTRPFFINCLPGLTELQINMHQEGSLLLFYYLCSLKLNRNIPVIKTKSLKSVISSTIEVSAWILAVQSLLSWPRCSGQVVSVGVCFTLKAADTNCGASCSMSPAMLLTVCTPFKLKKKTIRDHEQELYEFKSWCDAYAYTGFTEGDLITKKLDTESLLASKETVLVQWWESRLLVGYHLKVDNVGLPLYEIFRRRSFEQSSFGCILVGSMKYLPLL